MAQFGIRGFAGTTMVGASGVAAPFGGGADFAAAATGPADAVCTTAATVGAASTPVAGDARAADGASPSPRPSAARRARERSSRCGGTSATDPPFRRRPCIAPRAAKTTSKRATLYAPRFGDKELPPSFSGKRRRARRRRDRDPIFRWRSFAGLGPAVGGRALLNGGDSTDQTPPPRRL